MKVYLGLRGHTNSESLPLRFGIQITEIHQQFCTLEDAIFDPDGTDRQRQDEINRGNKHYTGQLCVPNAVKGGEDHKLQCRVVLGAPKLSDQLPPIVTILTNSYSHGDLTVTKHISGMVKRGRITAEDIIDYLHPAYAAGKIHDSNDVEEIYALKICQDRVPDALPKSKADVAILESAEEIKEAIESFSIDDTDLQAPPTFKRLDLSDHVKYKYTMADAYIEDAWMGDGKIWIKVLGSDGTSTDLHSFVQRDHLAFHHKKAFKYLESRVGQRAHFAVCLSEPCKGYLAESVTSIALQLMRK